MFIRQSNGLLVQQYCLVWYSKRVLCVQSREAHRGSITDWATSTHTHTHILVLCLPLPPSASLLAISLTEHITHTHTHTDTYIPFSLYKSFAFASAAAAAYYTTQYSYTLSISHSTLLPSFPFYTHWHSVTTFFLSFPFYSPRSCLSPVFLSPFLRSIEMHGSIGEAALNPNVRVKKKKKKKIDTIAGHFFFVLPSYIVSWVVSLLWQRSDKRMTSGGW